MSDASAQLIGQAAFRSEADAVGIAMENGARHVAYMTGQRMLTRIRERVRYSTGRHLRDRVVLVEHAAKQQFEVGFRDPVSASEGHPMVPVWHEFGTSKLPANPAVYDAAQVERGTYEAEMKAAVTRPLAEASR